MLYSVYDFNNNDNCCSIARLCETLRYNTNVKYLLIIYWFVLIDCQDLYMCPLALWSATLMDENRYVFR